jgi:CMP-N-acetylneuraminic acid synthetase
MNEKVFAIILGRKDSKGVPDKNTMSILDKPSYSYSFNAAKGSKYIDEIFVTSDHDEILNAASLEGFSIIQRPEYLCTDEALFEDALVHAYNEIKDRKKLKPKYIIVLMCNSVTINSELIDKGVELLDNNQTADSAVTVTVFNMYSPLRARKLNADGFLEPFVPFEYFGDPKTLNCDRGSQGDVYFADMSHTVCRSDCLDNIDNGLLPQKWMGQKILPVLNQNGCDIDEPWQIDMSIRWLKINCK